MLNKQQRLYRAESLGLMIKYFYGYTQKFD